PGFFLAFLYLIYIVGWAMIQPKIAPPLSEELTRVPVPAWLTKFQDIYSRNIFIGLSRALVSPVPALKLEFEGGGQLGYLTLRKPWVMALVPFLPTAATLYGTWWYVVIHQQAIDAPPTELVPLGIPGATPGPGAAGEAGPPFAFYAWFWAIVAFMALVLV